MCWGQDIPFLPYESWSLAFPELLSTQIFFPPNPNPVRESWVLGRLSFEAQEQGVHHQHTICYFLESVSPRLARCHLGVSDKIVELNQGVCKGKEIAYFMKILPSEASPSWAMAMVGQTRLRLRGPFVGGALCGLAQPLPFVGWSLHQRGCTMAPPIGTTPKISVSPIVFAHSKFLPFTIICNDLHSAAILLELHV